MRIIILAFIISISLHFLIFSNYTINQPTQNTKQQEKNTNKSDVKFVKLKQIEPLENKTESKVEQKIEKKIEMPKTQKETIQKEVKRTVDTNKKIDIEKPRNLQKQILSEQIVENKSSLQEKTLENFLSQKEPISKDILNELEKLYGKEYETFTKVQKAYLERNLDNFQTITQRVLTRLGYPPLAAKLKIGGVNIIEFMFHPDGSITNLRVINSSSYAVLDQYSLELIEIAYKDYPKPETTTKLRFQIQYRLY